MAQAKTKDGPDYSATLNLPRTGFPMKGDLPAREPLILENWAKLDLYARLRARAKGRPPFILHDGPPYANGYIHIGHALNKVLKDMVLKSRFLMGCDAPYVPGWDCHGLPIETALLKELKMGKKGVKDVPAFRRSAADFARKFIDIQREEFKRLGGVGDWGRPYLTMSPLYESRVLRAFRLLLKEGYIYRGLKPVYWCLSCETALAEAEIEYKDKKSPSVYVAMPISHPADMAGAEVLVWTTTPWTLPANMAVAFHPDLEYAFVEVSRGDWSKPRLLLMARQRMDAVLKDIGAKRENIVRSLRGKDLAPAAPQGRVHHAFTYQTPFGGRQGVGVLADYVTATDGTGVVHTAPGHGPDDFHTGQRYELDILCPVDASGRFTEKAGALAGKQVFPEGNESVAAELKERGWLLDQTEISHSYPHCWRCKNPIIFRATEQWFLNVSFERLRDKLLKAVDGVQWVPAVGQTRISSMVESRPDWCLSRQRVWGTPIPILFCRGCGAALKDDQVLEAVEKKVEAEGSDFWFEDLGQDVDEKRWPFLKACRCGGRSFRRETDILDVWMDSGASWLAADPAGEKPCDLYLEGSDQHRGWFQSSLVLSTALRGEAPFRTVLTHGFVLDEKGRAMHKSAGNVVSPQEVVGKFGADVLRLWAALSDYSDDVRISDKLLEGPCEGYRKFRNTVRYLLGNTCDFELRDVVPFEALPELERYILHLLAGLQKTVLEDYAHYRFRSAVRRLLDFCALDLSSFYLDILKDRLYTLPAAAPSRRAAQTVMAECLRRLLQLASPVLSFTAEEAWSHWPLAGTESVFLSDLAPAEQRWRDAALARRWEAVLNLRQKAQKALEEARAARKIGSSLQAKAVLRGRDGLPEGAPPNWEEILLVSQVELQDASGPLAVEIRPADGSKCPRCWRWQTDIGSSSLHPDLCGRCAATIKA